MSLRETVEAEQPLLDEDLDSTGYSFCSKENRNFGILLILLVFVIVLLVLILVQARKAPKPQETIIREVVKEVPAKQPPPQSVQMSESFLTEAAKPQQEQPQPTQEKPEELADAEQKLQPHNPRQDCRALLLQDAKNNAYEEPAQPETHQPLGYFVYDNSATTSNN